MAELTMTTFLTLDGVMQAPGGPRHREAALRLRRHAAMLKLVRSSTTSTGVVVSVYRRAGSLKTGSFALE